MVRRGHDVIERWQMVNVLRKLAALLIAGSFLLVIVSEASGQHRCPHHDLLPASSHHAPGHHEQSDGRGPCTCFIGCTGAVLATPPAPVAGLRILPLHVSDPAAPASLAPPRAALPYLLPYANGPPLLS